MKYLYKFNESIDTSEYYTEIEVGEWNKIADRLPNLDQSHQEYAKINDTDIEEVKRALKYDPKSISYRLNGFTIDLKKRVQSGFNHDVIFIQSNKRNNLNEPILEFRIHKYTDEWYIVTMLDNRLSYSGIKTYISQKGKSVYKCDQLEGLIKFLEDNK